MNKSYDVHYTVSGTLRVMAPNARAAREYFKKDQAMHVIRAITAETASVEIAVTGKDTPADSEV